MKHTDFYTLTKKIKKREFDELYAALQAHGGFYEWPTDEEVERPIIAVNSEEFGDHPCDVEITCANISGYDIRLTGFEVDGYSEEIQFSCNDVETGHLSYIIDYIPEINEIANVTIDQPAIEFDQFEVVIDVALHAAKLIKSGRYDSRVIVRHIVKWGREFGEKHRDTDWCEEDYLFTVDQFAIQKLKEFVANHQ